jgi:hypothetical protein
MPSFATPATFEADDRRAEAPKLPYDPPPLLLSILSFLIELYAKFRDFISQLQQIMMEIGHNC